MDSKLFFRLLLSAVFLISFFCIAPIVQSCADGPEPFSDFTLHPDVPLEKYAAGRLGILQPTFARSYLVVAYRYFAGSPLTKDEQFGAQAVWTDRIGDNNVTDASADPDREKNPYTEKHILNGPEIWLGARKQVTPEPAPNVESTKDGPNYTNYINCSDDAMENAARTLSARVKSFGKDSVGVKEWLRAQDTAFINCSGKEKPAIPEPAPASLPATLQFDREYQIAAARMYSDQFDAAEKAFEKIATEEKSPWHEIASYLVARNLVRRATLDIPGAPANQYRPQQFNNDLLAQAESKIQGFLSDPHQKSMQTPLAALLDRLEFHLHPESQTSALSQRLRAPAPDGRFYYWLSDYTRLLDSRADANHSDFYSPGKTEPQSYVTATQERQKDDLTDWILTFQADDDSAALHALQVWRAHPNSVPWLLSVLAKTNSAVPYSAEVLAAADKIPTNSPAYLTAFYYRMRLRNGAKQFKDVRASIDSLLKSAVEIPRVSKEELLDLRLDAAGDLDDALHFAMSSGCPPEQGDDSGCGLQILSPHGAAMMNSLPLDEIVRAFHTSTLPENAKTQIGRNIWMRAVLLNRHDVAQSLDSQISSWGATPQGIKPEYIADLIKQYEGAAAPDEKQFAAIFLLQHQYAFAFEIGTTEAWCASPSSPWHDDAAYTRTKQFIPAPVGFLTPEQAKQAAAERSLLDAADSQANFYARVTIEFAQKHPDDPRVPESLSRAVKNTDRNCNNPRTSALSKKAFTLLHNNYPNTSWAKNTKYWY
ncbi:MAG TPA: hypothetical protein VN025_02630 [Candidatus Dormibacteraeota bacterium]|jgi:hypothetical protein|nr:hypothetical protein [Candidatus Dormibacteraeota bacterium]